ncbi:hypothetical protein MBH78_09960 [Oceanimonas sp. NS1]|nr:hypothetical protein [Oceanimonas sp. NS1]
MNATRFAINAEPSWLHRLYLLGLALLLWLPAALLLDADRLPWFAPGWLLASGLAWHRAGRYRLVGEFNAGVLSLNGRSGTLSHHSRAGPGFLLLVLEEIPGRRCGCFRMRCPTPYTGAWHGSCFTRVDEGCSWRG